MADPTPKKASILGKDGKWYNLIGAQGPPGPAIDIKGTKANEAEIKKANGTHTGEAWIAQDSGDLWVWDGKAWQKVGHVKGADGKDGRSTLTFSNAETSPPAVASKPTEPATEPDKAHAGDVWIIP